MIGPRTETVAPFGWTGLAGVAGRLCGQSLADNGVSFSAISILPSGLSLEMKEFRSGEEWVAIYALTNESAQVTPAPRAGNRAVGVAIVAHNTESDRAFCERLSDAFVRKAWACSYREVAWTSEGLDSARLGHLAIGHGLFFDTNRAAPFIVRAALKSTGYRWNDGSNGIARAWFVGVDEQALEAECEFLRSEVYRWTDLAVEVSRFTSIDRYSERCQ